MKILMDTVTFLRAAGMPEELSPRARGLLTDSENERYLSTVSAWEIVIKHSLKKLTLKESPDRFIPEHRVKLAAETLPLDEESALQLMRLPFLHSDPFDRMLICQAIVHGMVLLTPDERISRYSVRTAW
jgi:PIN domain nuclease of toxin-antitoxin system